MDQTERKHVHVVAAILHRDGLVLATQRGYGEWKDYWEFPGGKVEAGETEEQAIVREIREELMLPIRVEKRLCMVEYDYEAFHLSMQCFLCAPEGEMHLLEHEDARWLPLDRLQAVEWLPADETILPQLLEWISGAEKRPD